MYISVAKRRELSKPDNIKFKSDSIITNNKFNYEYKELSTF